MEIHFDGFTIGHQPSNIGGGYSIVDQYNNILVARKVILKTHFTSNEGELQGCLAAAELASWGDTLITDSMNTFYWVRSGNPKARPDLKGVAQAAKRAIQEKNLTLEWRRREENLAGHFNELPFSFSF